MTDRIELLVWSKDRACQLHLLLESIERFARDIFTVTVIYKSSNDDYQKAYDDLFDEFDNALPYREMGDANLTYWTKWFINSPRTENIAFTTDDTIIYRDVPSLEKWLHLINGEIATFSLRYGLNTTLQNYHTGEYQPALALYDKGDCDTISWMFAHYHPLHNYGYPFGLDMHIYKQAMIQGLTKYENFKTTNELESMLFHKSRIVPQMIRSFEHSVAVNIPCNNMSGVTIACKDHGYSTEYLNEQYLAGKRLNLDKLCETKIIGCHQEIPLELV